MPARVGGRARPGPRAASLHRRDGPGLADGRRPLSVGFWFSLGHCTIVLILALLLVAGVGAIAGPVGNPGSGLHEATGWIGALVSGSFLYLIAALNAVVLLGVVRMFLNMRRGPCDDRDLEQRLRWRGLMFRLLGGMTGAIDGPTGMYPVGLLFGLGLDTASEVLLLVLAGGAAGAGLPWYSIVCMPILFAAGMSLMDSLDGSFMSLAYGWACSKPVRNAYYNIAVTALSVMVAMAVGTVQLGGMAAEHLHISGSFWAWLRGIDVNLLGFVIVGIFLATWILALAGWRLGRIDERWGGQLGDSA